MARWFLGPPAWKDLEAILSDRPAQVVSPPVVVEHTGQVADDAYRPARTVDYAELHAHSHFSFLDGASRPEDMVEQAVRLGLGAITLVDHDGLPGAVRFAKAAEEAGIATVFGAELTLGLEPGAGSASTTPVVSAPRTGSPDPEGEHLLVLVRDAAGYRQLSAAIARAHLDSGQKAAPRYRLAELSRLAREGHWLILTGCRTGAVTHAAADAIIRLVELFGPGNVAAELIAGGGGEADELHDALAQGARLARESHGLDAISLPLVATTNAHYARPADRRLADTHAALRAGVPLAEADPYLGSRPDR